MLAERQLMLEAAEAVETLAKENEELKEHSESLLEENEQLRNENGALRALLGIAEQSVAELNLAVQTWAGSFGK